MRLVKFIYSHISNFIPECRCYCFKKWCKPRALTQAQLETDSKAQQHEGEEPPCPPLLPVPLLALHEPVKQATGTSQDASACINRVSGSGIS